MSYDISEKEWRVVGPPGCGKTHWLQRHVQSAVSKHGPTSVYVWSLTKAAAKEAASRDLGIPEENVSTLHSCAWRAIGRPKLTHDKEVIGEWNKRNPLLPVQAHVDWDEPAYGQPFQDDLTNAPHEYSMLRCRMIPRELWPDRVRPFAAKWEAFKAETETIDYVDMIERALMEVDRPPGRPVATFCDESQDMDRLQLALVRSWGRHTQKTIFIGDPFQNLYEWRGTDADAFDEGHVKPDQRLVLSQSYRVPRAVHAVAVEWLKHSNKKNTDAYHPRNEDGEVRQLDCQAEYPYSLLRDLEPYLAAQKRIMVLTSCNRHLSRVLAVLQEGGIPFHNPYRTKHGGWNLFQNNKRALAYLATGGDDAPARLWTWHELSLWTEHLSVDGIMVHGAKARIKNVCEDKKRSQTEVTPTELSEIFLPDTVQVGDLDWLFAHRTAGGGKSLGYLANIVRARGAQALKQTPKVIVGTIHSVKGGEADVVYLFPNLPLPGWRAWNEKSTKEFDALIRLYYVGITRARETLIVCRQKSKLSIPADLLT
jgi:superfamily I DNA/RNA helicase